jgi:uncharacterized protein (TIGR03435 family)
VASCFDQHLRTTTTTIALLILIASRLPGQTAATREFDLATVKSSPPPAGDLININLGTLRNGRLTFTNASLSDCLKYAYDIFSDEQITGPDWIKSKSVRFDIVAQVPPDTPLTQVQVMLRSLLEDRLKLTLHHENKNLSYLALVVSKNGLKIHGSKVDPSVSPKSSAMLGHIVSSQISMQRLAMLLSRFERQTVIDQTGLSGNYEINLNWTHQPTTSTTAGLRTEPDVPETDAGPSIFTALQEQLGLRLESNRGPVDVLVIDHAEQTPTEN